MKARLAVVAMMMAALCAPQAALAASKGKTTIGLGYASGWPGAPMSPSLRIGMDDLTIGADAGWTTTTTANTVTAVAGTTVTTVPGSGTTISIAGRVQMPIKKEKAAEVYFAPGLGLELTSTGATTTTVVPVPAGTPGVTVTPGGSTTKLHVFGVLGFGYDLSFFNAPNVKLSIEGGLDLAFGTASTFGFVSSPFSVIGGAFHYYF